MLKESTAVLLLVFALSVATENFDVLLCEERVVVEKELVLKNSSQPLREKSAETLQESGGEKDEIVFAVRDFGFEPGLLKGGTTEFGKDFFDENEKEIHIGSKSGIECRLRNEKPSEIMHSAVCVLNDCEKMPLALTFGSSESKWMESGGLPVFG